MGLFGKDKSADEWNKQMNGISKGLKQPHMRLLPLATIGYH